MVSEKLFTLLSVANMLSNGIGFKQHKREESYENIVSDVIYFLNNGMNAASIARKIGTSQVMVASIIRKINYFKKINFKFDITLFQYITFLKYGFTTYFEIVYENKLGIIKKVQIPNVYIAIGDENFESDIDHVKSVMLINIIKNEIREPTQEEMKPFNFI
jgi:hypothetical protein